MAIRKTRKPAMLRPLGRSLTIGLLRAREAVMTRFRPVLRRHGVTEQQWRVMRVLAERRSSDASALAAASCIHPASLSRILPALGQTGMLRARPSSADSRRLVVELTALGRRRFADIGAESEAVYRRIEREVGRRTLESTLQQVNRLAARLGTPAASR
ncbi:MAG TPA: homoprotocatechuate degradation operon regulator HpaR [Steroidobacteraceae bacterium]